MRVTKELKESVQKYIKDLVAAKPSGGEVNLDDICKKFPNENRWEIVTALRNANDGVFVTGRRGLKSRFVYGEAAKPMIASIKYRQDYREKHKGKSGDNEETENAHSSGKAFVGQSMALRIGIGDRTTIIPISIEMVPTS